MFRDRLFVCFIPESVGVGGGEESRRGGIIDFELRSGVDFESLVYVLES